MTKYWVKQKHLIIDNGDKTGRDLLKVLDVMLNNGTYRSEEAFVCVIKSDDVEEAYEEKSTIKVIGKKHKEKDDDENTRG